MFFCVCRTVGVGRGVLTVWARDTKFGGIALLRSEWNSILLVQTATISTRPNNTAGLAVIDVLCLKTTLALATVAKHARASRKVTPRWRAGSPVTNRFPFLTVITSHQYQRRHPPPPLSPLSVPFFSPAWPTIAKPLREALRQGQRGGVEGTQPHIVDQQ